MAARGAKGAILRNYQLLLKTADLSDDETYRRVVSRVWSGLYLLDSVMAEVLGVSQQDAAQWREGHSAPRPRVLRKKVIMALTKRVEQQLEGCPPPMALDQALEIFQAMDKGMRRLTDREREAIITMGMAAMPKSE